MEQGSRFLHPAMVGDTVCPSLVLARDRREAHRRVLRFASRLTGQRGETLLEGYHVYRVLEDDASAAGTEGKLEG